ncbi:hypothetical protein ACRRTK_019752 [Alexandromys fortis]
MMEKDELRRRSSGTLESLLFVILQAETCCLFPGAGRTFKYPGERSLFLLWKKLRG